MVSRRSGLGVAWMVVVGCAAPDAELATGSDCEDCALQVAPSDFLVADRGLDRILSLSTAGEVHGVVAEAPSDEAALLDDPSAVRLGPDGSLFVACFGSNRITRWPVDGPGETFFHDVYLEEPVALAWYGDGLLALGNDTANVAVITAEGALASEFGYPDLRDGHDMALGPDGLLYVATSQHIGHGGAIQVWDVEHEALVDVFGPPDEVGRATGLAFGPDGALYVADHMHGQLLRFEPPRLDRVLVSEGLAGPLGVAFGPDGRLYVADEAGIHAFDPETGESRGPELGLGDALVSPRSITFVDTR